MSAYWLGTSYGRGTKSTTTTVTAREKMQTILDGANAAVTAVPVMEAARAVEGAAVEVAEDTARTCEDARHWASQVIKALK